VDVDKSCWEEAHGRKSEMGVVVSLLLDQGCWFELIFFGWHFTMLQMY
jgi:hypothetical protein